MQSNSYEPGLLTTFRLLAGFRFVLVFVDILVHPSFVLRRPLNQEIINLMESVALFLFLSWPAIRRITGWAFLPTAILWASLTPILENSWGIALAASIQSPALVNGNSGQWEVLLQLLVPLIVVSWQYGIREMFAFSFGTLGIHFVASVFLSYVYQISFIPGVGLLIIRTIVFVAVGYLVVRLMTFQREQRKALWQANVRLTNYASILEQLAISRERNRLARELHDVLAHNLSGVAVQLEAADSVWDTNPSQAHELLVGSLKTVREGLSEARRVLQALRAQPLEELGLSVAIQNMSMIAAERGHFDLEMDIADSLDGISPVVEQCIYRVAQESISNVIKHAQATHLTVSLRTLDSQVLLSVTDDGLGFDDTKMPPSNHFGLQGMRERVELLNGNLDIHSTGGRGTAVQLRLEKRNDTSLNL